MIKIGLKYLFNWLLLDLVVPLEKMHMSFYLTIRRFYNLVSLESIGSACYDMDLVVEDFLRFHAL